MITCRNRSLSRLTILLIITLIGSVAAPAYVAAATCYVAYNADGANNGSAWASAYTDLQSALSNVLCGEIWVAQGTYKPTAGTDRTVSFRLKNGVAIYGGFAAGETLRLQRDPRAYPTILSGNIGTVGNGDNSFHVVVSTDTNASAVLDGFTVTAGNANVSGNDTGGGLHSNITNTSAGPTLRNINFVANNAARGGGMYNIYANLTLTAVTFVDNTATNSGGGLYNSQASPSLSNVTFSGNSTGGYGGGMYNYSFGSDFPTKYLSNPTLNNVTFSANLATSGGGAMYNGSNLGDPSQPLVPVISNSIFYGNGSSEFASGTATPVIKNSIVAGGCPAGSSCTNIITSDPGLGSLQDNGGYTLTHAISTSGAAFNAGGVNAACAATDQRGVVRPQSSQCDIGAFEFDNGPPNAVSFTLKTPADSTTDADALVFLASFSEVVSGVDKGDFSVNDSPDSSAVVSEVSQSAATTWDVTVSGGNLPVFNGTINLNLHAAANITDLALNALSGGEPATDQTYTLVNVGSITVSKEAAPADGSDFDFTSDALVDGDFRSLFGEAGSGNGQFSFAADLAVGSAGKVYVVDRGNHRVQVFDASGAYLDQWGGSGGGDGKFSFPTGLAVDGAGQVYVADTSNHRIQVFDSSGTLLRMWGWGVKGGTAALQVCTSGCNRGSLGSGEGQFSYPADVAVDSTGRVYVSDRQNSRIQVFDGNGTFLAMWGGPGSAEVEFNLPESVALDSAGRVYVADTYNNRIQVFDAEGLFLRMWGWGVDNGTAALQVCTSGCRQGLIGYGDGRFNKPEGIFVNQAGRVYVADTWGSRIQVFDTGGHYLAQWGSGGSASGEFALPRGLDMAGDGRLYVADANNHRVQIFDSSSFTLDAAVPDDGDGVTDTRVIDGLPPGSYSISEMPLAGWMLTDLSCDKGNWVVDGTSVTVDLAVNDHISCTFSNTALEAGKELTTSVIGSGDGYIVSTPAGISCGASCTSRFAGGTLVQLSAYPTHGEFTSWAGACAGSTQATSITLNADSSCSAEFTTSGAGTPLTIEVFAVSPGDYVVVTLQEVQAPANPADGAVVPQGLICQATCEQTYDSNTPLLLTAVATTGSQFDHWEGSCSGSTASVELILSAAASCKAIFVADQGIFADGFEGD